MKGKEGGLGERLLLMLLTQAQSCHSDLSRPLKMLLLRCLHSSLFSRVLCNAAREEDWAGFTSVGGLWEQVGGWRRNQVLHRYLEVCLATDWHKKTSFIGRLNAYVTFFMPYICSIRCSASYFTVRYLYFLFTAGSRGLICVINVPGTF